MSGIAPKQNVFKFKIAPHSKNVFGPKSNGLKPTASTLVASSQLAISNHWPCYCTLHVYVVIHVCDKVRYFFEWKQKTKKSLGWVDVLSTGLTPPQFCSCYKDRTCISNVISRGLFLCSVIRCKMLIFVLYFLVEFFFFLKY